MSKNAIIYARWSTLEQGNEDRSSEERQIGAASRFAKSKGWTVDGDAIIDSGRSAFTGANLTKGELGSLTKRLLSGALDPRSTVIVVEELDRLSRQPPGKMTLWMVPLLEAGLTIAIANTGQIVTEASLLDFGSFVTLMSQSFSGYEFSRKQVERGNGSWAKRRRAMIEDGKLISRQRGRKWLAWNEAEKRFDPIAERVSVIKEMFRLRLAGWGKLSIAKELNRKAREGDASCAVWVSTKKRQPTDWTVSAIARIVQDPAVTGHVQLYRRSRAAEGRGEPIGEPVRIYPEVIDPETFARANDQRLSEQLKTQGRGRNVSNLLGPVARCSLCGGQMTPLGSSRYRVNADGTRSQHYFLYCQTAKMTKGEGCRHQRGWTYSKIEKPILDRLLDKALDDQFFAASDDIVIDLEGRVAVLKRKLDGLRRSSEIAMTMITDADGDHDDIAQARYDDLRSRVKAATLELTATAADLAAARGKAKPAAHVVRVADLRVQMDSDDADERYQARSAVRAGLRNLLESVNFNPDTGTVIANMHFGIGMLMMRPDDRDYAPFYSERGDVQRGNADAALRNANAAQREAINAYMERRAA